MSKIETHGLSFHFYVTSKTKISLMKKVTVSESKKGRLQLIIKSSSLSLQRSVCFKGSLFEILNNQGNLFFSYNNNMVVGKKNPKYSDIIYQELQVNNTMNVITFNCFTSFLILVPFSYTISFGFDTLFKLFPFIDILHPPL